MGVIRIIVVNDAFVVLEMYISIPHLLNSIVEEHHMLYGVMVRLIQTVKINLQFIQ